MTRIPRALLAIRRIRLFPFLLVIPLAIGLVLWLLVHRPGWWSSAGDRSPAAAAIGAGLEQAISREVTLVREPGEWGFVLTEEDVNAWLVNRLDPWLESRGDIELPEGVSDPRVRFGDGWIEVGLLSHQVGVPIFTSARFEVRLDGADLTLLPIEGRMAFATFDRESLAYLSDYLLIDGRTKINQATGEVTLPAIIELMDGRRVILTEMEVVSGELAVRFRTVGP